MSSRAEGRKTFISGVLPSVRLPTQSISLTLALRHRIDHTTAYGVRERTMAVPWLRGFNRDPLALTDYLQINQAVATLYRRPENKDVHFRFSAAEMFV